MIPKNGLTEQKIDKEKIRLNTDFFRGVLAPNCSESSLVFVLQNLGRLPSGFNGDVLLPLLSHPSADVRIDTVKNIGKLKDIKYLTALTKFANSETNSLVKREAVSALGRLKSPKAIKTLIHFLDDRDAKIVLQAIRALLYLKKYPEVIDALTPLAQHSNELIGAVLTKELNHKTAARSKDKTHAQSPDVLKNVLVQGDVREIIKCIPDDSVHLTFTSPPYYNARDYTIYHSYEDYLDFLSQIFTEVHRITKEGRFFILNTSPVIIPRMSRKHSSNRYLIPFDIHPRLTEMGWEFIEDIVWKKPDPSARNRNGGFFQHRKPLAYKANSVVEYVLVYRKKTDKLIDWNLDQYPSEIVNKSKVAGDYEKTNVWKIAPANDKVHPAIFPRELANRVIQLYSLQGDLIFDPFAGSATVGYAAVALQRYFLLAENEPTYIKRAESLLRDQNLFCDRPVSLYSVEQFREVMRHKESVK
ncbi:MAG: HEAT repeat domain-containing protein [Chloroflexi bacterium]|nr:HEAT repeat domain-containing protein [Chloroflexota bacterium]